MCRRDKQLRTIKESLKVAIAKHVDLKSHIEKEERKLSEVQDPKYSDHDGLFWPILLLVDLAMLIIRKREQTET